ncbi:glutamate 5-kinase [Acidithiobacillus caldus]|jgi:glutamate 5-kinase|uniref:Glutamate 5-kinase n=1 Tax=Acidithiobacillus caldus (strain ATCC 51756 / DSM 8584 / KU) TaxID=637389 RepID=A0A059ZV82_ACICK|nr:glutamate 5-kinase [Acidithiobacillus caldus]AIA56684.1 hypothetical protein Acaty_m0111 [Acidithiobacillus caldus ATCC 51756]MBU2730413.1 glutamate 5-kinase [Acidithiobacillus caldus]MBU2734722.1 glutamate 5-kinase [Acidithiobacillus caldus ATCC 51756]MBU2744427.1 glutamate 5-kinase [Acidithiobacillus caldus]MBU2779766.1 glutamate 5-kinase [Acidithiobacillus caldus]
MLRSAKVELRQNPSTRHVTCLGHRWVIKVGSSVLTRDDGQPDRVAIRGLVFQIAALREQGVEIVLVSSGSVSVGQGHLRERAGDPGTDAVVRRVAASLGQAALMRVFQESFEACETFCGQLLLTSADLSGRHAQRRLRRSLGTLLTMGAVPIVNENDATTHAGNGIGNNDLLAAHVARAWRADLLVLLTDQGGLYTADPRRDALARLVEVCHGNDPRILAMAGGDTGVHGTGGMATKIQAAILAGGRGIPTRIAAGRQSHVLLRIRRGERVGTWVLPPATWSLGQRLGLPALPQPAYQWA